MSRGKNATSSPRFSGSPILRLAFSVFLTLILFLVSASGVAAQVACTPSRLNQAADTYTVGHFVQTFDLLRPCLPDAFQEKDQRISAYRLMALTYIATDSLEHARVWVRHLLKVNSRFRPDPEVDPAKFSRMVAEVRPRWYTWLWQGNEWYKWAGRGALAVGVASVPLLLRGSTEPDLPNPPVFPGQ